MFKKIKFCVTDDKLMPTKAHKTDAGWDLYSPKDFVVQSHSSAFVDTQVKVVLPRKTVGMIKSKSGLNCKHGIVCEGVIDEEYTGTIGVKLYNHSYKDYAFKKYDKITQLVVMPYCTHGSARITKMPNTDRGEKGFGSSGK